jgi:hypothetical protein
LCNGKTENKPVERREREENKEDYEEIHHQGISKKE